MITVTTEQALKNAISSSSDPEILVANNIVLNTKTTVARQVTISGREGVSLLWGTPPLATGTEMLIVNSSGNLTIKSLILDGNAYNVTLVEVLGGKFTMSEGAVLKNISGLSNPQAVAIGKQGQSFVGSFIMNGGLITEINSNDAVFCNSGTIVMNNNAAISGNMATGITMLSKVPSVRSTLIMSGTARIANNQSKQSGAAGLILDTDIIMGVNPGDAPSITGNISPFRGGGLFLLGNVTLTMGYKAEISNNYAPQYGGGLIAQTDSIVSMHDEAAIKNNESAELGGGVLLLARSILALDGQSAIYGNICGGKGGGIYAQNGAVIELKDEVAIHANKAENGGGIFLDQNAVLNLMGQTSIKDNIATTGKGVYKIGIVNVSQTAQVLDGLFFNDLQSDDYDARASTKLYDASSINLQIPRKISKNSSLKLCNMAKAAKNHNIRKRQMREPFNLIQPAYCNNVPVIIDTLTENAKIQLESSSYLAPDKVPLVIADKGDLYENLGDTDCAAWLIPPDFEPIYKTVLNNELDQVLIIRSIYNIIYYHLFGVENTNPVSYNIFELPLTLLNPGIRPGYTFVGWYNASGERITAIYAGTAGNLSLSAVWEESS